MYLHELNAAQLAQHNFGLNGDQRLDDDYRDPEDDDDDILDDGEDEC